MSISAIRPPTRCVLSILIWLSGFATLSWEVIWQVKSSLALGVSAWGTAITLAVTMGGMCVGGFLMGRMLHSRPALPAIRIYAILELIIGLSGLALGICFASVEYLDTLAYAAYPASASLVHVIGVVAVLGVPTICMGATFPVFGLIARQTGNTISELYGLNTSGAAIGVLCAGFIFIPLLGISNTILIIAGLNTAVAIRAWLLTSQMQPTTAPQTETAATLKTPFTPFNEILVVFVTGFATFALEIAWFRSLTAAFGNTTDNFAIMLGCVLIALGAGAKFVPKLQRKKITLGALVIFAGIAILLATPLIERFDFILSSLQAKPLAGTAGWANLYMYAVRTLEMFLLTLYGIGLPILLLGMAFPWIMDSQRSSHRMGVFYALNTFGAIVGAICAAWLLLPTIGFTHTAWLTGILVVTTGIIITPSRKKYALAALALAAFFAATHLETGIGKTRIQGKFFFFNGKPSKILESYEGPDATVSVVEYDDGGRRLLIDANSASGESGRKYDFHTQYMQWMGRLPMLAHPDPKNALVICFGTGQTANAVRNETIQSLDIVDLNPNVFKLAHNFASNQSVLYDPRVTAIAMDGRAYMRRVTKMYDVITLEPMPPTQAGVNSLYSKEFYQLARNRLRPQGTIAQWLPFHSVASPYAAAIARTFVEVFPNAILWINPSAPHEGILLGSKDQATPIGQIWPGLTRSHITPEVAAEISSSIVLTSAELAHYGTLGDTITDDNQLLAYGKALYSVLGWEDESFKAIQSIKDNRHTH